MTGLCTLDELKGYLAVKTDTDDALLEQLILSATSFLLGQMNRREGLDYAYEYTPAISPIPEDIRFACMELAALRFKEKSRLGKVSEGLANQTTAYSQKDLSDFSRSVVNQYKRVTP